MEYFWAKVPMLLTTTVWRGRAIFIEDNNMGKALRVFVIFLLLLSIASLVLGILLFQKRELIKGRTQMLEEYLIKIGKVIESEQVESAAPEAPDVERDIAEVTDEVLDTPDLAAFWENYAYQLEEQELDGNPIPTLDLNKRRDVLMTYYLYDEVEGKVVRDPRTGYPMTTGDGTMHDLLEDVLAKAENQYNLLNDTRQQLRELREELLATINDLNSNKKLAREKMARITSLLSQIAQLEQRISDLQGQIAMLEEQIRELKDEIRQKENDIQVLEEEKATMAVAIKRLEKTIEDYKKNIARRGSEIRDVVQDYVAVDPGEKGRVAQVNPDWNFVILQLSEEFVKELTGDDRSGALPQVELMVKRGDGSDTFVTKVRLVQIKRDKNLGVADILTQWQQEPIKKGDIIFY
jgi:DNA repair exonuclease SbcCD ATPase subunit